ncbi:MarR family winged helix-turn-helix transcriptional regulator [Secundilactobacillus kimchicus]|uniref:MarR family winged helix-turn-helix transcriptional regulator n=1 Tax=Secundilactobacillus kimchicus TaxID=528209 RepID=UPI0006E2E812|nr:helix-turn-helix domain-containing protein [Secundilactobacillus kimchicus]
MEKLAFYKRNIENPLINIINTRAQDNNFERQWIQLHLSNRDLQYAISQLSTLNLRVLQQLAEIEPATSAQLISALDLTIGVVTKHLNKLSRLGFVNRKHPDEKTELFQLTPAGSQVVETQNQLSVLLDQQHARLVEKYTPEELDTVAAFLKDLQQGH